MSRQLHVSVFFSSEKYRCARLLCHCENFLFFFKALHNRLCQFGIVGIEAELQPSAIVGTDIANAQGMDFGTVKTMHWVFHAIVGNRT